MSNGPLASDGGARVSWTNATGARVHVDQVVAQSIGVGVSETTIEPGGVGALVVRGPRNMPAVAAQTMVAGALAQWDGALFKVSTGAALDIGIVIADKPAGQTFVHVNLNANITGTSTPPQVHRGPVADMAAFAALGNGAFVGELVHVTNRDGAGNHGAFEWDGTNWLEQGGAGDDGRYYESLLVAGALDTVTLPFTVTDAANSEVFFGGNRLPKSAYTLVGSVLTFTFTEFPREAGDRWSGQFVV